MQMLKTLVLSASVRFPTRVYLLRLDKCFSAHSRCMILMSSADHKFLTVKPPVQIRIWGRIGAGLNLNWSQMLKGWISCSEAHLHCMVFSFPCIFWNRHAKHLKSWIFLFWIKEFFLRMSDIMVRQAFRTRFIAVILYIKFYIYSELNFITNNRFLLACKLSRIR